MNILARSRKAKQLGDKVRALHQDLTRLYKKARTVKGEVLEAIESQVSGIRNELDKLCDKQIQQAEWLEESLMKLRLKPENRRKRVISLTDKLLEISG